jgi:type II secretory pathway pseudopilin PulG
VIGILSTIGIASFTGFQTDARDTQRSSKATILAEALEKYYDKNGEYPGCLAVSDTNASTVTTNVLPGIQSDVLLTPKSPVGTTNSIQCTDLTTSAGQPDIFSYMGGWWVMYERRGVPYFHSQIPGREQRNSPNNPE